MTANDYKSILIGAVLGFACFLGYVFLDSPGRRAQVSQPSVPALIAPACDGRCNPARVSNKPFTVVCPSCRSTLSVQPSATGSVGQVVGDETAKVTVTK